MEAEAPRRGRVTTTGYECHLRGIEGNAAVLLLAAASNSNTAREGGRDRHGWRDGATRKVTTICPKVLTELASDHTREGEGRQNLLVARCVELAVQLSQDGVHAAERVSKAMSVPPPHIALTDR